ncbi:hypothetical protein VZT92_007760 [Zoarces viviparus]|uniref:Uncharacterized protein n=1 Tax=Zoarces viviparus TaxID=48416 RepID=A0AAW1FLK3_ZOAVI
MGRGVNGCLLDMQLYVSCNPQGHRLTCRLCIPQHQFVYKSLRAPGSSDDCVMGNGPSVYSQPARGIPSLWDILFLLFSRPFGRSILSGDLTCI